MRALLCAALLALPAACGAASLEFSAPGAEPRRLPLGAIAEHIAARDVALAMPFLDGKRKRYRAYPLAEVLDFGFGADWRSGEYADVVFTARDGYESVSTADKLAESGGWLAFADLDGADWEPLGRKRADPAPLFLIWTSSWQTTGNAYPWPWAVARVSLTRVEDKFPATVPKGAAADSPAARGYATFKSLCLRCHAVDQDGGKIGPDLNAPRNILSYRKRKMVRAFIKRPSQFRYGNMPDHEFLSDAQLDELLAYLTHMGKRKKKEW